MRIKLIIAIVFCFCACSGKKAAIQAPKMNLVKGQVTTIQCVSAPLEKYSLYLPKSFNEKKASPVVIFLDSHGKGFVPVDRYKELSDTYGYVFAGSNAIQNGMDMNDVISVFFDLIFDLKKKIDIDSSRIYRYET